MSQFSDICEAWKADLEQVSGLAEATFHLYAPWSVEELSVLANERHIAIWPDLEAESVEPLTASPFGGDDLATQVWAILVWEDASDSGTRLKDDDDANMEWLTLAEAIRARLYASANLRLGDSAIMDTRYAGLRFTRGGSLRIMELAFRVRVPISRT